MCELPRGAAEGLRVRCVPASAATTAAQMKPVEAAAGDDGVDALARGADGDPSARPKLTPVQLRFVTSALTPFYLEDVPTARAVTGALALLAHEGVWGSAVCKWLWGGEGGGTAPRAWA